MAELTPEERKVIEDKAVQDSNLVDAWLAALKLSDPVQFESVRRLKFTDQAALAGVQLGEV